LTTVKFLLPGMKNVNQYKWFQLTMRQRLSPFPNVHSMESITKEMKTVIGRAYEVVLLLFEGNIMYGFFDEDDYGCEADFTFSKLKKNPKILAEMIKKITKFSQPFLSWLKRVSRQDLTKVKNQDLIKFHNDYIRDYKKIYSHYFVILTLERPLAKYLRDLLQEEVTDGQKAENYFNILITEPKSMVARQEERAGLKLAVKISKNKKWLALFKLSDQKIIKEIKKEEALYKLIRNHEKKFFWLTRDYEDPILTISDIIGRLKKHLQNNPIQKLANYEKENKDLIAKRKKIIKELKLSSKEQVLFIAMRDGLRLKELRKSIVSQSLYYYDSVLNEICRRAGLNLRQVRFLVGTNEVSSVLKRAENWDKILNERLKRSGYFTYHGKTKIIAGKEIDELFERLIRVEKDIKEIKGFSAATGKATGRVIVVMNPNECAKMKRGDIIVTAQVVPAFSPWIAMAGGLICDGGTGITSHPATLAREAKIPCVTGTRVATRVLRDGQQVEVDGYKGMVRILK